jgi:HEAT repeat protein
VRDFAVRQVVALSYRGGPKALREVRRIALESKDPAVRRAAFNAAAGLGGPIAVTLLSAHGLNDTDPSVRLVAADGLLRTGSKDAALQIRAASLREVNPVIREMLERAASSQSELPSEEHHVGD